MDKPTSNQQLMTWFLVQDYITGRRVLSTPDISVPSPAQPFIKYSLPLVPCSWSIHGSRLAQRCNGLWGSSSANGLNGGQKHRGKIWQSKDPNGKPIRTQISMVTWTSQAHTTYSVCVCACIYIRTYIYVYITIYIYNYIYIKFSQRMLFTYHFFGSGLVWYFWAPHGSTSSRPLKRSSNPLGWSWSCPSAPGPRPPRLIKMVG